MGRDANEKKRQRRSAAQIPVKGWGSGGLCFQIFFFVMSFPSSSWPLSERGLRGRTRDILGDGKGFLLQRETEDIP